MACDAPTVGELPDDEVIAKARTLGWRFGTRTLNGTKVWTWRIAATPDDTRFPAYSVRAHAISWMRDRLQRGEMTW